MDREDRPKARTIAAFGALLVKFASLTAIYILWLQAQEEAKIPLDRLDGPMRAKVLAALAGLVILGLGLMALTWLGARVTWRYMHPKSIKPVRRRPAAPAQDDWASKPLVALDDNPAQEANEP